MITIIAAIGRSNELGKDDQLIWHLSTDMKFFKETTTGHPVVMGHKTFLSLPKPLPNRHNIVITHAPADQFPEEVKVIHSFAEFMEKYAGSKEEIFIIGGAQIYHLFKSYADRMYLTHINEIYFNADTFFPTIQEANWTVKDLQTFTENGITATIRQYDRK